MDDEQRLLPEHGFISARMCGTISVDASFECLYRMYSRVVIGWLAARVEPCAVDDLLQDVCTVFYGRWREWQQPAVNQITASADPRVRLRPQTLWIELEDLLLRWRELWNSKWFATDQNLLVTSEWSLKDMVAHVASWAVELRAQAEIVAGGTGVDYRILFVDEMAGSRVWNAEKVELRRSRSLEELFREIERETVRFQDLLLETDMSAILAEYPIGIAMEAAPDEPWIRNIAGLVELRCRHDWRHMECITVWKRAKSIGDS